MKTKEILSIAALVAIALCLICGVAKTAMKSPKQKQSCDTACSLLVFVAVVLVGISQLLDEGVGGGPSSPGPPGKGQRCLLPSEFPGSGLQGNCKPGLVCKSGYDTMPICMSDGPSPGPSPVAPPGSFNGQCLTGGIGAKKCKNGLVCGKNNKCGECKPLHGECPHGTTCTSLPGAKGSSQFICA